MSHQSFTLPEAVTARINEFADELADLEMEAYALTGLDGSDFGNLVLDRMAEHISDTKDYLKKCLPSSENTGHTHLAPALLDHAGREFMDMAAFLNCLATRSDPALGTALTGFASQLARHGETARHLMQTTLDGE